MARCARSFLVVHQLAHDLAQAGFEVIRTKVEAVGPHRDLPLTDDVAARAPRTNYFEHHAKVVLPSAESEARVSGAFAELGAYLSRGAPRADGVELRFVTLRSWGLGQASADDRFDRVLALAARLGLPLRNRTREYTVYDSALEVDAGWMSLTLIRSWLELMPRTEFGADAVLRGASSRRAGCPGGSRPISTSCSWVTGASSAPRVSSIGCSVRAGSRRRVPSPTSSSRPGGSGSRRPGPACGSSSRSVRSKLQVDLRLGRGARCRAHAPSSSKGRHAAGCRARVMFAWKVHSLVELGPRGRWHEDAHRLGALWPGCSARARGHEALHRERLCQPRMALSALDAFFTGGGLGLRSQQSSPMEEVRRDGAVGDLLAHRRDP